MHDGSTGSHQLRVDEAVRGGPRLGRDEAVEGELLLGAVNGGHVVGGVALLGVGVHLRRTVPVLWHESVDGDRLGLYPRLGGREGMSEEVGGCGPLSAVCADAALTHMVLP